MAGKGIPQRHISRTTIRLSDRNVNEVCLYFKELRIYSATQTTLNPVIAVKALPKDAKTIGGGEKREETGEENEEPTLKLDFNPAATRKPGQVLKLHTTYDELTSKEGAKFGWVDKPGPKTRQEALDAIERESEKIRNRLPVVLKKYKRDAEGTLTTEVEQEVRIKALGRTIGSSVGRVSTTAFQAAGGIIDANGKLRCPPGTPNANQFTDVDMSNCAVASLRTIVGSVRRVGSRLDELARIGSDMAAYGRVLTPFEREQQDRFKATRGSAVLDRNATVQANMEFDASVNSLLERFGVERADASSSANADLIAGLHGLYREQYGPGREEEADRALKRFLFGTTELEKNDPDAATFPGGIFADAGSADEVFAWEGDFSPESIAANTERYDAMLKRTIISMHGDDVKSLLSSANPEERKIAEAYIQLVREKHHAVQRESLMAIVHMQNKYPEATERLGQVRAFMAYDLREGEGLLEVEGSTVHDFDEFGDLKAVISVNALGQALDSLEKLDIDFARSDDGSLYLDTPGAASEVEKRAQLLRALEQVSDAIRYAEIVGGADDADGYANQTSAARLEAAFGLEAVRGRARHVMLHEFGHVMQLHAAQQKIIEQYKKTGKVVIPDGKGGLLEYTNEPSLWSNDQWVKAVSSLHTGGENIYQFPPGGATRFEQSLVNLFAGRRYQQELRNAEIAMAKGEDVPATLKMALLEGSAEIFAQRELGILGGPEVEDSIAWMLPENIETVRVRPIPYDMAPGFGIDGPPDPDAPPPPDIPTNVDPPTDTPTGAGGTTINIVINAPINIVINNNYGPDQPGDGELAPAGPTPKQVDIGWTDIAGHIYFDNETQWQPGSLHNLPLEQNPDEVRRLIDVGFGLGLDEGGPDPADPLGEIRQAKDAYWKMTPEILDTRYEKLDAEFKKLVAKSETDGLSTDEQARMWLAAKGMRQILDINTRKSLLNTDDVARYEAQGFNPQPGKYMRQIDSPLHPKQKGLRKRAMDSRNNKGYVDVVEVDDDELAHWSREIGSHAGDALEGKDGFDGSSLKYERGKIRNTPGPTSKEKRRRNPEYKPTKQEIEDATLISDPSLVGRRKMDEMSADLTPEQKFVMESDEPVEMSDAWNSVSDALGGDVDSLRSSIDTSARARQRLRDGAGSMSKPDSKSQDELIENQIKETIVPTLDILERATTDSDMSIIAAIELDEDLVQGAKIDHSGPLRGLLIDGESADGLKFAEPQTTKRVMVTIPKGSRAMHTKNAHDGDTDGVLIPPGTLEVMKVDPDGTVVLMPTHQKTKSEVLRGLLDSVDGLDAERASFADSEKRALKSVLRQELKKTPVPNRSTRGASGDPAQKLLQTNRSSSVGKAFRDSGSSFFGTESTNRDASSLTQSVDNSNVIGRMVKVDETRQAKSAELTKLFDELVKVRDGEGTSEEYWELFNEVSEQTKQLMLSSSPEKLMRTVEETVFKYHESFDDRPRMAITPSQLTDLIGEGVLKNAVESKPNSIASGLQKTFEKDNGLSDSIPENMRSNFGYLTHSSNQKEIQDYLDGLPSDGLVRNARFFSNTDDFGQHQEFKVGGKSVELILVPETARRTAYTRGDVMDGGRQATPMLSSNRAEVLAAHVSGPNSGNSEIDNTRETIAILDSSASGSFAAFGTPSGPTRSTRSRNDSPSAEAVIGGGIRVSDIQAIRIDSRDIERYDINADEIGGREKLKKILAASGITGNLDEILDTLLSGDFEKQEQLSPEAQNLMSTFAKMRMVLGARKLLAEHNARGGQPELIFANPDGIDIGDIDSFTDLKHIDPNSSIEEKLFERLRYDAFGAVMRKMPGGNKEQLEARNKYRTTGRLSDLNFDASLGEGGDAIDDGSGQPIDAKPVNPKTVDLINAEVEKGRTTGASELSRVGKGQRTQIDTRRSKLIEKITYDDSTNELIVTWKGNESGRGTERYTGFPPELIRVLEETFKDDSDGSTNPILISEAVNHIANVAGRSERMPNESAHAAALSEAEKARIRSEGLRSVGKVTSSGTESELSSRVARSISDPKSTGTRSTSSPREIRGTSGNTSTTPPSKRGVVDIFEDVHNLGDPNDPNSGLHGLNDTELFERYGIERTGNMSLSDGQEVFVVNDLETAGALLAAGYHVELGPDAPKPTLLVEASGMLQKQVDAFLKGKGLETNKVIDTCRLYSAGTNLWCEGGLGTVRKDMPQISGRIKGDDTPAARMVKAGVVKTDWKGGKRDANGVLTKLTPEEELRFNELKAKHAKLKDGTVIPDAFDEGEKEEFYSMVDWNDTEADFTKEYKEALKRLSKISNPDVDPDTVVFDEEGLLPTELNVSQGQIQMAKTGGMVKSMRNHDHSFKAYMSDLHPDIEFGSKEYYEYRSAWLDGKDKPDGSKFAVPFIDGDGQKLDKDGDPIQGDAAQEIINQPWFTRGSIISTIEGEGEDAVRFVVDGHHRWASFAAYNELLPEEAKLKLKSTTLRIPIADALAVSKAIQEHFGIKPAVLGNETMFERADGIDPIDMDGKTSHIEKLFEIGPDGVAAAQTKAAEIYKELYVQQEGFGFVQSVSSAPSGKWRGATPTPEDIKPGADLSGANLSSANLVGANLRDTNLRGANLGGANLREADLRGADLHNVNLRLANLERANLAGANLSGVVDMAGANLEKANLAGLDLAGANMKGTSLKRANLTGAHLSLTDLSHANMNHASMGNVNLENARLDKANLSSANLTGANLHGASLFRTRLISADLSNADFSEASLSDADLSGANLTGADLRYANLSGVNLTNANLRRTKMRGANVEYAKRPDGETFRHGEKSTKKGPRNPYFMVNNLAFDGKPRSTRSSSANPNGSSRETPSIDMNQLLPTNLWRNHLEEYEPIPQKDYSAINNAIQSDMGIPVGQIMQDEYDEGLSIKEIAENWGLVTEDIEKLLSESKRGGTRSARINRESQGRDATPEKEALSGRLIDLFIEKASPVAVIIGYDNWVQRRKEKKNPALKAERLAREAKLENQGITKPGKSGIAIAEKEALQEYKSLMEKVSISGGTTSAKGSARTAEVQKLVDNLASKVDGDLDGMDFSGGDFSGVDFKKYSIRNVSFFGSNLDKANFSGCIIEGSSFEDASLIDANLTNISRAWKVDFSGANLTNADLTGLNMHSALLNETNLEGAKLDGVNLIMADIRDMDFSNAQSMRGVLLEEVQGEGANFSGLDMTNSSFTGSDLKNANFRNANLEKSDLRAAHLDDADFGGANIDGIELEQPGLSPRSMKRTIFDNTPTKDKVSTRSSRGGELPPTVFAYDEVEEADVPGKKAFRDNSTYVTENADGTFNAYTIENVPGTELGYLKQAGDNHESLDAAKNAAKKQGSDTASRSTRSSRSSRELPPTVFAYDEVEEADVPGKKAFRDNSTYVTENADGTFNAYTIENVPGTELGYLKQAGDNHESLDAAKNAAKKQGSDTASRSTRSTRSSTRSLMRPYRDTSDEELQTLYDKYLRYLGGPGDKGDGDFTYMRRAKEHDKIKEEILRRKKSAGVDGGGRGSLFRPYRNTSDEELKAIYDKYQRYLGGPGDKGDGDFTYMRRAKEFDKIKKEFRRRTSTRSLSNRSSDSSAEAVPSTEAQKTWKKLHDLESKKKGAINDMTDSELAELGISRSSREGIIDGKPVYVAETQESAVALMSLGYNVELGDGARARKVKRAVAKLQEEIDAYLDKRADMSPEEKASYKIDSCRMYIANTNIFCGKNIGTKRMDMPQISGRMKGDDTVAARAAKAGLVKTSWEAREDLTPEERSLFDKLKARHPNPSNKFPEGESPLTEEEKKEFYSLVDWKDTEVDFVPKFMDHLRRVSGRDNIVTTRNGVDTSEFTASQGQIQAEKVSGMLAGIEDAHDGFVQWAESRGAKRGSKEYLDLRKKWLDGKFNGQIPILDENGQQKVKKGKPQFADPWWAMGTVISSKDGYIVDGHHRWAAVDTFNLSLGEGEPPLTINTQELDVGIFDALNLAKSYQTEIGIKQAKLGLEDPYAKAEGIPAMSADEFAQFDADTDTNVGKNYEKVRDSRFYVPDGPYVKTTGQKPTSGFIQRDTPRTTRDIFSVARRDIASTRSSRAPRSFSDDYPSMAAIGISPRSESQGTRSTRSMSQSAYMLGSLIPIATVLGGVAAVAGGFDRKPKNLDGKKRPNMPSSGASGLKKRDYLVEMAAHILKTENDKSSILKKIRESSVREKQSLNDEIEKLNSYSDSLRKEFDLVLDALDEDSQKKMNEVVDILNSNRVTASGIRRLGSIRNQPRSTRSSTSSRSFSDDYPSMGAIGISPRSSSGPDGESADDALSDRQLAEAILSGASVAERKEMEQIAASVVADVQKQKNDIRAQIVTELGSQEALDELLDFEKPTPKAWTALSPEKRQAINEMLDRVSSIENESFTNAQNQLLEIAERRRQARNANISAAKRVAELGNPSTRSSQAPTKTGTRFVSDIARGVGEQVNKEKLFRDLSGAFKRNGASGVLSELRKTLRNDSSGWAIDYALKEGYISKNQAGILRKLASKLFKKPRSKARGKSFDNSPVVIFADLLSPPFVTHKEESWL